jgi:hypothetical protein
MSTFRVSWIIPALIMAAATCPAQSFAQAPAGGKAPPGQSQDLADVCAKSSAPEIKSDRDIQKLSTFLKERGEKTTQCADIIKGRIAALLKGEQPWAFANEQIGGLVKLAHDLVYTIEGANGVREQVVLLIAKVDNDAKRVKDHITDKSKQEKLQASLLNSGKIMKDALNQVDDASKQLKERAYDLEKRRPELAFEWQLENYKAIAMAVSNLADSIKSQADVLGRAVPTDLAKAQP